MEQSKEETANGTAVEILVNEPYGDAATGSSGQYTHKVYHIDSRVPKAIKAIVPASMMVLEERAWNAYPNCKTVLTNRFMGERFFLSIESVHLPDKGQTENALSLPPEILRKRKVVNLDIAKSRITDSTMPSTAEPSEYSFEGHGPLRDNWQNDPSIKAFMCCYKMVTTKFKVFGLESKADSIIEKMQYNMFLKCHKYLFCHMHEWLNLSIEDIREIEDSTRLELEKTIGALALETKEPISADAGMS